MTSPSVLLLDPGNFTPFYDMQLGATLIEQGWDVEWVTSRYQFEDLVPPAGLPMREAFRCPLRASSLPLDRSATLRRAAKAVCYPIDLKRFHRGMRQRPPGIVHVQWSHLPFLDASVWADWRLRRWKVVYTVHDVRPLPGTTPRFLGPVSRGLLKHVDALVVHSREGAAQLLNAGIAPDRVHHVPPASPVVPNGGVPGRGDARRTLGLPLDRRIVLFLGFIKPYKGLDVLLEAFPAVRAGIEGALLVIAGESLESLGRYHRSILRLGLTGSVHWNSGFVPTTRIATYFAAADVVALPYLDATSSGVLLAAYSFRRPVVASAVGGLPELVESGRSGILVPPSDPPALAAALCSVLGDPARGDRMGVRGRWLTEQRYSWSTVAGELGTLYRGLCES